MTRDKVDTESPTVIINCTRPNANGLIGHVRLTALTRTCFYIEYSTRIPDAGNIINTEL